MILEGLLSTLLVTCPGTDYRHCGDVDPVAYSAGVIHGGNHDDGSKPSQPGRSTPAPETPDRPDRPDRPDTPACR